MGNIIPRLETISILTLRKTNAASAIMALAQLKDLTLADLYFVNVSPNRIMPKEYEPDYCIGMAKKLICGDYQFPVDIQLSSLDGHIICYDGRHRICIAQKLNGEHEFKVPVKVNFIVG